MGVGEGTRVFIREGEGKGRRKGRDVGRGGRGLKRVDFDGGLDGCGVVRWLGM